MITRWEEWYSEENLTKDERILSAPSSLAAESAAREFIARGKRFVLDLACGIGRDTFFFESQGLCVTGVDASFNGVQVAQRIGRGHRSTTEFITADARHLPFKEGSFEGVYCFGLLHEFTNQSKEKDVAGVMGELKRLLGEEGLLALSVVSGEPEAGLPDVQLFSRSMFDKATQGLQPIEVKMYDDVGCTGRSDYHIWYGVFQKVG